jgi:hypothetical protein
VAILLPASSFADAARPAAYADVVVTYSSQSFGFAGPLRYFEASAAGGRIGIDLISLGTPDYAPRPDIGAVQLRASSNRWQLTGFGGRSPLMVDGTCAVESFATTQNGVTVQHVYLNCIDLDVAN